MTILERVDSIASACCSLEMNADGKYTIDDHAFKLLWLESLSYVEKSVHNFIRRFRNRNIGIYEDDIVQDIHVAVYLYLQRYGAKTSSYAFSSTLRMIVMGVQSRWSAQMLSRQKSMANYCTTPIEECLLSGDFEWRQGFTCEQEYGFILDDVVEKHRDTVHRILQGEPILSIAKSKGMHHSTLSRHLFRDLLYLIHALKNS